MKEDLILTLEMVQYLKMARATLNKIEYINEESIKDLCLAFDSFKCELMAKKKGCRE